MAAATGQVVALTDDLRPVDARLLERLLGER
jgi:hypothetical protein